MNRQTPSPKSRWLAPMQPRSPADEQRAVSGVPQTFTARDFPIVTAGYGVALPTRSLTVVRLCAFGQRSMIDLVWAKYGVPTAWHPHQITERDG